MESCKAFCILVESSALQTQEYHNYNSHFTWQPQVTDVPKRNVLRYVAFMKPTERALRLLSSTTLPFLRLFPNPTAYSSFGTKTSAELTFLSNCCYLANLHVRQTRALQYNSMYRAQFEQMGCLESTSPSI